MEEDKITLKEFEDTMDENLEEDYDDDQFLKNKGNALSLEIEEPPKEEVNYGNHFPFWFYKERPIFTIGPDISFFIGTFLF